MSIQPSEQIKALHKFKNEKSRSSSEIRRVQALILWDKSVGADFIEGLTCFRKNYILTLLKKYLTKDVESLQDRPRAKPRALLTKGQREQIANILRVATPRHFGFDSDTWTTQLLGFLIEEQYNVRFKSRPSLYLLFREARFTYHKPEKQYKNKDQVDNWIRTTGALITQAMQEENTVVLFEAEMMLFTKTTTQKIWLPPRAISKNRRVFQATSQMYLWLSQYSNWRATAFKSPRANTKAMIKCLQKIGSLYPNQQIIIVWNGASWHKSAELKDYLSKIKHNFTLIPLPPYSPELNLQEHVWKAGRTHVTHNQFISDIDKASSQFVKFLNESTFSYRFP